MFNVIRTGEAPASLSKKQSWSEPDVIQALRAIFYDKCYICETKDPLSLNVEHFDAHEGDDEKKFLWENIFFACARCNNLKRHLYNNLLNCTDPKIDVLRLIKHYPPVTPFSKNVVIEPGNDDPKTIETANLISKIFNDDNTGNKDLTGTYLRKRVYKKYASLIKNMNVLIDDESMDDERSVAVNRIRALMGRSQEYSAFLRWAVLESPELFELVGDAID